MAERITFAVKAPNWLGDAVMALPAVSAVADASRRGRVLVLGSRVSAGVYSRLEGTVAYPVTEAGGGPFRSALAVLKGSSVIRSLGPVIVLSLTRSFTSAAMCFLGCVPRRVGFEDSAGAFLYTDRVRRPPRETTHMIDTFIALVEAIGVRVENRVPGLRPLDADVEAGERLLGETGLKREAYICLFPGARYGPAKMWPARRFGLLADTIADKFNLDIVLAGGRQERSACQAVEDSMSRRAVNLCGLTDLSALIGLIRFSKGVVSNDSGGMHLSAALDKPVVGLFFSTAPAWTGPVSGTSLALYRPADCSPCFGRDCPRGNACTESIGVEEVLHAVTRLTGLAP
jgi:heptosyltransferase-2